jgi:hypothetical protein
MLYKTRVLKDQPVGFWPFDTVSTILSDASGNGNNASSSNILGVAPPLTAKGVGGILLSAPDVVTLPINTVMNSATPGKAFSFEFFYKPTSGTNVWICKRDDSGIHLTDSSISFTVSMLSDLVISYDKVSPGNVYYVVAVYDTISIKLYVTGSILVARWSRRKTTRTHLPIRPAHFLFLSSAETYFPTHTLTFTARFPT